jgi:hypothetical protein
MAFVWRSVWRAVLAAPMGDDHGHEDFEFDHQAPAAASADEGFKPL